MFHSLAFVIPPVCFQPTKCAERVGKLFHDNQGCKLTDFVGEFGEFSFCPFFSG